MLYIAFLLAALLCTGLALLPCKLRHRGPTGKDAAAAAGSFAAVLVLALCIYSSPGLGVGFDAFRLLAVLGLAAWLGGCVLGFRLLRGRAMPPLLLACALGAEIFLFNAPYFATHGYQPLDLKAYWDGASTAQMAEDGTLTLDAEHNTLYFSGIGQPLYNLQLENLQFTHGEPYVDAQDPLFTFSISATDEGTSRVRQGWTWDVAWQAARSHTRTLDLAGAVDTLTLQANAYDGEYIWYTLAYTLDGVRANVPRPFLFSLPRLLAAFGLLFAGWALRPSAALWREAYLTHGKKYRPAALACAALLAALAVAAPFADPVASGVATRHYNVNNWDESSRLSFTAHINDWQQDAPNAQYGSLAHSLLNGRLDILQDPPQALTEMENPYDTALRAEQAPDAMWDIAYYNGRYYVYFGVVPCLLFQLPFELLLGIPDLPHAFGMIVMAVLMIAAAFGLVREALVRWFPDASTAAYLLTSAGIVAGSQLYFLLLHSAVYEYAILCGASFVMLALWQWMCAANTPVERRGRLLVHLALGSLCMALAAGCRPQMEVFAFLAVPLFWPRYVGQKRLFTRQGAGEFLAFALPVMLVAAGLMWYNAARFGSPFDFGANYNLTSNDMTKRGFRLGRIAPALFTDFLSLPVVQAVFPYLQGQRMMTNYAGITITEPFYGGVLTCLPLVWSLGLLPAQRRRLARRRDLGAVLAWTVLAALLLAVLDCEMAGVLYRYLSDFLPVLLFAAALGWLLLEETVQSHSGDALACLQTPVRLGLPLAVAAGAAYNFCVFFGCEPYLYGRSPALFQTVSRLVQFWL